MVRAQPKQTPDEKKEAHKKKAPSKKKVETGTWPCKMNGCNKVFAREADLKRHQRTTKLHSMPGFACPQCDATFTRTDALRRHQKSRHNGIIIEPSEPDRNQRGTDGDAGSSGSKSPSPSRSQGEPSSSKSTPPTALAHPGTAGPASGSSYYRQHTMSAYPPQRPPAGIMVDPHYAPAIGLPTSATRLHQANWHPAPPWGPGPDGHPIPTGAMYHVPPPPGYYSPSPYYRHPSGMMTMPPHHQMPPHVHPELVAQSQNGTPSHPHSPGASPAGSADGNVAYDRDSDVDMDDNSSQASDGGAPVIDPSLDQGPDSTRAQGAPAPAGNAPVVEDESMTSFKIAQAAVQAVLNYEKNQASRAAESGRTSAAPDEKPNENVSEGVGSEHAATDAITSGPPASQPDAGSVRPANSAEAHADGKADLYGENASSRATRSPAAEVTAEEQMMTEDGEPMLNPAELLTQESLASPPPS